MKKKSKKTDETDALISKYLGKLTHKMESEIGYKMDLAAKIFRGVKALGWNRSDFAREMNVNNSVITKWLSGYNNFEIDTLHAIEQKLGIKILNLGKNDDRRAVFNSDNVIHIFNFNAEAIEESNVTDSSGELVVSAIPSGAVVRVTEKDKYIQN